MELTCCKQCGEPRRFLDKQGVCVLCTHPRQGKIIYANKPQRNVKVTVVKSKIGSIRENGQWAKR